MQAGEERSPDSHIRLVADTLLSRGRLVKGGPPLGEVLELDQVPDRGERRADDGLHGVDRDGVRSAEAGSGPDAPLEAGFKRTETETKFPVAGDDILALRRARYGRKRHRAGKRSEWWS